MRKLIFILLFATCYSLKSQTVIDVTTDTIYFFIFKNDTVVLEPTMVTPGMSVITNYNAVGAELYLSDNYQSCCDYIVDCNLKCSEHSTAYLKKDEEYLYTMLYENR